MQMDPHPKTEEKKNQIISTSFIMHSAITRLFRFEPDRFDPKTLKLVLEENLSNWFTDFLRFDFHKFVFSYYSVHLHITRMPKFSNDSRVMFGKFQSTTWLMSWWVCAAHWLTAKLSGI